MENKNSKRLLVLSLGLCFLSCSVSPNVTVYRYATDVYDDITNRVLELRQEEQRLKAKLENPDSKETWWHASMELENVKRWLEFFENNSQVAYKDYKALNEEIEKHEQAKESLRRKLEKAEGSLKQVKEDFSLKRKVDRDQIKNFQEKLKKLTGERDKIVEEYAKLTESQYQEQRTMNKEKLQLLKDREEMKQKLEKAQDLHSQALEAMAVAFQEGYKPVSIPYQEEINKLKDKIHTDMTTTIYEAQVIYGLLATQAKLEALLKELHQESQLSSKAAHKDIESELVKIERDAARVRDHHVSRRHNIVQNIRDKKYVGYDKEEIADLQNANQQVADTDKALQEVARRSAYLKAISQVKDLIKDCQTEVRSAIERRNTATEIGQLPTELAATATDLETRVMKQTAEEETGLTLYKDPETIADIIYQKVSFYKDLHEFYRTKLSTEIVNGLAKVNKRPPIPFPGCEIARLIDIRNKVGTWADGVQYALRLSKQLNKGDNKSVIARLFLKFLTTVKKAFSTLSGRKKKETNLEDDDEVTTSMEEFEEQETGAFDERFKFVTSHLFTLDIDAEVSEGELKEFRYNLIFLRKAPQILEENTLTEIKEIGESSENEESLVSLREILKEADIAEKRLQQVYTLLISEIKSTLKKKDQDYQVALEEYKQCRYGIFQKLNLFKNIG